MDDMENFSFFFLSNRLFSSPPPELFLACPSTALHVISVALRSLPCLPQSNGANDRLDPWQIGFNEFPFNAVYRGIADAFGELLPPRLLLPWPNTLGKFPRKILIKDARRKMRAWIGEKGVIAAPTRRGSDYRTV